MGSHFHGNDIWSNEIPGLSSKVRNENAFGVRVHNFTFLSISVFDLMVKLFFYILWTYEAWPRCFSTVFLYTKGSSPVVLTSKRFTILKLVLPFLGFVRSYFPKWNLRLGKFLRLMSFQILFAQYNVNINITGVKSWNITFHLPARFYCELES